MQKPKPGFDHYLWPGNYHRLSRARLFFLPLSLLICIQQVSAQSPNQDTVETFSLDQCIAYSLKHQPMLSQALINQTVTKLGNQINLSGWLPQLNLTGNITHYTELPTSFVNNSSGQTSPVKSGVVNTAIPALSLTQNIFSPSLLYAYKAAPLIEKQARQITDSTKIFLVSAVSKSFYSLLLTLKQIEVLREDTARLGKSFRDSYHQYVAGIVDETDYDQAAITLNNSIAQLKQVNQNIVPQYAFLKQAMGYPPSGQFNVIYDSVQLAKDILFDTTQQLQFEKRVEFQQIQTIKGLQQLNTSYYKNAFLPSLSAFFNYNLPFENNSAASLFSNSYPYSYAGLTLSLPVFTGFSRIKNLQRSKLQEQIIDLEKTNLESQIYSEYTSALANYRGNLYNLDALRDNMALAHKVYDIVKLQYLQGVVAYLNVITAESNLITSEIGYLNAYFQVLSSKIDLEKSMGIINY